MCCPPRIAQIASLRHKVTPYAFELIVAQAALAVQYRAVPLEGQDDVDIWHRQFKVLKMDENAYVPTFECDDEGTLRGPGPEDFGLHDTPPQNGRITSIVACSCQFAQHSGLDLCRHRINRAFAQQDSISSDELNAMVGVNIASKWLSVTAAEEADATRVLRMQPTPRAVDITAAAAAAPRRTANDRYAVLLAEMKPLAEAASQSEEHFVLVQQRMRALHEHLLGGVLPPANASARPASNPAPAGGPQSVDCEPPEDELESTADGRQLLKILANEFECYEGVDQSFFEDISLYVWGQTIAYKWKAAGRGGWHIGAVGEYCGDEGLTIDQPFGSANKKLANCTVEFSDGPCHCALYWENYVENPTTTNVQKHYWTMIDAITIEEFFGSEEGEDLSQAAASGRLRPPQIAKRKGKPTSKRFKPAHGPTSQSAHRARRK
jgi:hypothetical protein